MRLPVGKYFSDFILNRHSPAWHWRIIGWETSCVVRTGYYTGLQIASSTKNKCLFNLIGQLLERKRLSDKTI